MTAAFFPFSMMSSAQRPYLDLWLDAARLGVEAQAVIGLRLLGMATGSGPAAEAGRLVPEKIMAFTEAQALLANAVMTGRSHVAAAAVVRLYRRRVRANHRRLSRPG